MSLLWNDMDVDFSVTLSGDRAMDGRCAASRCNEPASLILTLGYCFCEALSEEHGTKECGSDPLDVSECTVCERHGTIAAHSWESFVRLRSIGGDPK